MAMRKIDACCLASRAMSAISIGIQVIMPKTGTSQQPTPPPANDNSQAPRDPRQGPPPPPDMGKFVDKTA